MDNTITQNKLIHVVSSRPLKDTTIEIGPDASATDVLEKAGFNASDYMLMKPGDREDYGPTDLPFNEISDGGKLHVVPHSTVGA